MNVYTLASLAAALITAAIPVFLYVRRRIDKQKDAEEKQAAQKCATCRKQIDDQRGADKKEIEDRLARGDRRMDRIENTVKETNTGVNALLISVGRIEGKLGL